MQMYLTFNHRKQQVSNKKASRQTTRKAASLAMDFSQLASVGNGYSATVKSQESGSISSGSLVSNSDRATDYTLPTSPTNLVNQADDLDQQHDQQHRRPSFYIDELGFYRHLDGDGGPPESWTPSRSKSPVISSDERDVDVASPGATATPTTRRGDNSYEAYYNEIRSDLRISHFDRIVGYDEWKRGWDEFMKVKMGEPAVLNQKLKHRVRTGIPHDYRSKMWTAIISMRTNKIRASMGEHLCGLISRELATTTTTTNNNNNNNSNNNFNMTPSQCKQTEFASSSSTQSRLVTSSSSSLSPSRTSNSPPITESPSDEAGGRKFGWLTWRRRRDRSTGSSQQASSENQRLKRQQQQQLEVCFKQIELDLLRTLPNNCHFETSHSRGIHRVRKVLRAYALFNPTIGYCQGMNRLAAMALLVLPEQEAFWCLVTIIQCIMPKDYYLKPWLAQVDCDVMKDFMAKRMARLHKHLTDYDIHPNLFSWFFTIFVDGFRPELLLRIWDSFLLEGDQVLFKIALAIIFISHDDLLTMSDSSTIGSYLNRLVSTSALDVEHLFEVAFVEMNFVTTNDIKSRREYHRKRLRLVFDES